MTAEFKQPIRIPEAAIKYLLPQRTDYRTRPPEEFSRLYEADIEAYAQAVRARLPSTGQRLRILDIGCGLGIGLLAMARIYGSENDFVGLDKDQFDPTLYFGLKETAAAYNSLDITRNMLALNGIPNAQILNVDTDGFPIDQKFDLIVSLIAWGFHFPARTYAAQAHQALNPKGHLVIDLRTIDNKDAGGLAELEPYFDLIHQVQGRKFIRSFFQRK